MSSFAQRSIALLATILALNFLQGCYRHPISQPQLEPNTKWHSEEAGIGASLHSPDSEIFIRASNSISTDTTYFGVSFWFDPKRPGLQFDPNDVTLSIDGVGQIRPARFNLVFAGDNSRLVMWKCGNYPPVDFGPGPPYKLRRGFCAELYFDIKPPSPKTEFRMQIHGFYSATGRVTVPDIYFREAEVKVWDFLVK